MHTEYKPSTRIPRFHSAAFRAASDKNLDADLGMRLSLNKNWSNSRALGSKTAQTGYVYRLGGRKIEYITEFQTAHVPSLFCFFQV